MARLVDNTSNNELVHRSLLEMAMEGELGLILIEIFSVLQSYVILRF